MSRRRRRRAAAPAAAALVAGLLVVAVACSRSAPPAEIPALDLVGMEPQVRELLSERRAAVVAEPASAEAWGRFGMACHAHDLVAPARDAYRRAAELAPDEARWHYYLGDVESVLAEDLGAALAAFARFLELDPEYAPAHLRVGRVLVQQNRLDEAAAAFARAVELDPELVPARVGLGQVRLAQGRIEEAVAELEVVVAADPGHGQALAALGQAYLRLGRADDARRIADEARRAGRYVLFDDPLMAEVVAQGASALAYWERARAFLDDGQYHQALAGLRHVLPLRPDDPSVHEQMALAYSELGERERAREHLERVVELDPERREARLQLALFLLDADRPAEALPHLRRAADDDPDDPEVAWLLGRALAAVDELAAADGELRRGVERAATAGIEVPVWVWTEWGTVLARQGRFAAAVERFAEALERRPDDARALYSYGLALEGLGRTAEAIGYYRRSLDAGPNPLARARLAALGAG